MQSGCVWKWALPSSNGNLLGHGMINAWRTQDTQTLRFPFHPALWRSWRSKMVPIYQPWLQLHVDAFQILRNTNFLPLSRESLEFIFDCIGKVLSQHPRSLRHLHVKHGGSALGVGQRRSVVNTLLHLLFHQFSWSYEYLTMPTNPWGLLDA
jgi:hypothetical protein